MRRLGHLAGILVISCLLVGCGGGGESTATPENLDAAAAAMKKMKLQSDAYVQQAKSTSAPTERARRSPQIHQEERGPVGATAWTLDRWITENMAMRPRWVSFFRLICVIAGLGVYVLGEFRGYSPEHSVSGRPQDGEGRHVRSYWPWATFSMAPTAPQAALAYHAGRVRNPGNDEGSFVLRTPEMGRSWGQRNFSPRDKSQQPQQPPGQMSAVPSPFP